MTSEPKQLCLDCKDLSESNRILKSELVRLRRSRNKLILKLIGGHTLRNIPMYEGAIRDFNNEEDAYRSWIKWSEQG